MATAMREAEKAAEAKRLAEEQRQETVTNARALRQVGRSRQRALTSFMRANVRDQKMFKLLERKTEDELDTLGVAASTFFARQDDRNERKIAEVLEDLDRLREEFKKTLSTIQLVNISLMDTERQFKHYHKMMSNINKRACFVASNIKIERRIEMHEHQYGAQLAENQRLLARMRHLQGERGQLVVLVTQLEKDIADISKHLTRSIDLTQSTYERRDIDRHKIEKMHEHMDKMGASFSSEMHSLQFKIDVLRRMDAFMCLKNKTLHDEGRDRRARQSLALSAVEKQIIRFADMKDDICGDLQEKEFHAIIRTFMELEEENYALFQNISETRNQCNAMQNEIRECRILIGQLKANHDKREMENLEKRCELMEKVDHIKREADRRERYIHKANHIIKTYIKGTLTILGKLNYTDKDIERVAGVYKVVEERNVLNFLQEIERFVNRVHEVKTASEFVDYWALKRAGHVRQPEPLPPRLTLVSRAQVAPPSQDDDPDVEDPVLPPEAFIRPLTAEELSHHINADLERQQQLASLAVPEPAMNDEASPVPASAAVPKLKKASFLGVDIM